MTPKRTGLPPLPEELRNFDRGGLLTTEERDAFIYGAEWATFHDLLDAAMVEGVFFPFELVVHEWVVKHCIDAVNSRGLLLEINPAGESDFRLRVSRVPVSLDYDSILGF